MGLTRWIGLLGSVVISVTLLAGPAQAADPAPSRSTRRSRYCLALPTPYKPYTGTMCPGGEAACIDDVIAEMEERLEPLAQSCSHHAIFSLAYLRVTENVRGANRSGYFADRAWLNTVDAIFADMYFRTMDDLHGRPPGADGVEGRAGRQRESHAQRPRQLHDEHERAHQQRLPAGAGRSRADHRGREPATSPTTTPTTSGWTASTARCSSRSPSASTRPSTSSTSDRSRAPVRASSCAGGARWSGATPRPRDREDDRPEAGGRARHRGVRRGPGRRNPEDVRVTGQVHRPRRLLRLATLSHTGAVFSGTRPALPLLR